MGELRQREMKLTYVVALSSIARAVGTAGLLSFFYEARRDAHVNSFDHNKPKNLLNRRHDQGNARQT
jgi:hypothetical protein